MAHTPFQKPQPQAIAGLNSVMVYGENLQVAVGLNHQLAIGSNLQLCVNPSVLEELLHTPPSPFFSQMCGSGLGGNMQFTVGTSTNVVWGRTFNVTIGPAPAELKNDERAPLMRGCCMLLCIAILVHIIAYGAIEDDNGRATEVLIFQVTIDLLLAIFMACMLLDRKIKMSTVEAIKALFKIPAQKNSTKMETFRDLVQYAVLISALVLPPLAAALEESHFQGDPQATPVSEFQDSSTSQSA
jgi:hypothetical protein